MNRESFNIIKEKLQKNLSEERFTHSLGVSYTAACLAMRYGADIEKAELAGLIHDCAKELYDETPVSHALNAPKVAKEMYGINDEDILSAIMWHTTGKADMTLLEKIIYVADFIEPGRKMIPILSEVRELAFKDLTYTVYRISERTLEYLKLKDREMDPHSEECYLFLKENECHDK